MKTDADKSGKKKEKLTLSQDVLNRVRTRDPDALGQLFDAYFPVVYGTAFRLLGNRDQAQDASQDVFCKVHRAADQLDTSRDPAPWLVGITYNVCRDYWRSRAHRLATQSASLDEHPALGATLKVDGPDPETQASLNQREILVQEAIMSLPEDMRTVVILHDYQGMTHEEISHVVGASHAAVRKRYSRALSQLAKALKDQLV